MPKLRDWKSHNKYFKSLQDADFYCIYGQLDPNAKAIGRPQHRERKYLLFCLRNKRYKNYKCVEHRNCDHQLRIDLENGNEILSSGVHSGEKSTAVIKRRKHKTGKETKEAIQALVDMGVTKPFDIKDRLRKSIDTKKMSTWSIYNVLRRNDKKRTISNARSANPRRKKVYIPRTFRQKLKRNHQEKSRRKTFKDFRNQLKLLRNTKSDSEANVTIANGKKIGVKIPDNDQEMIDYLTENNYEASNLSRSDLVLRYTYLFLAKSIHTKCDGKYQKTFQTKLVTLLKDDIERMKLNTSAKDMLDSFFKQTLRRQYFSTADVSSMLDQSARNSINLKAWEEIRSLEENEPGISGMLPSRSAIQKEQKNFEAGFLIY